MERITPASIRQEYRPDRLIWLFAALAIAGTIFFITDSFAENPDRGGSGGTNYSGRDHQTVYPGSTGQYSTGGDSGGGTGSTGSGGYGNQAARAGF